MKRVLVVDDEFGFLEALTDVLTDAGFAVSTAGNGRVALQRLKEATHNLILTNYMMPEMNGLQLIAALHRAHVRTPIVLVSGVHTSRLPRHLKVAEVLTKPFGLDALLEVVNRHLA